MALIHHNGLRVNKDVPDDTVDIWRDQGWTKGLHKDSDPDDLTPEPRVLPAAEDEEPEPPSKATKATKKES